MMDAINNATSKATALPNNTTQPTPFDSAEEETKIEERDQASQNSYLARLEEENRKMKAEIVKLKYRERPIFKPDQFKWIIITIKNYDKLRQIPEFS